MPMSVSQPWVAVGGWLQMSQDVGEDQSGGPFTCKTLFASPTSGGTRKGGDGESSGKVWVLAYH